MNYFAYKFEDWTFTIFEEDGVIMAVDENFISGGNENDLIKRCSLEIIDYLRGKGRGFSVPFKLVGTEFQKSVWEAVCEIPYGQTRSYRRIAEIIHRPRAYRAVGTACAHCALLFLVPCQRVVSSSGSGEISAMRLRLRTLEADML